MKSHEVVALRKKLVEFNALEERLKVVRELMHKIQADDPDGPCGQGPFTGNTRESRRADGLVINFTKTLGGSPAVSMSLMGLNIPAGKFEQFLLTELKIQEEKLTKSMDEI